MDFFLVSDIVYDRLFDYVIFRLNELVSVFAKINLSVNRSKIDKSISVVH